MVGMLWDRYPAVAENHRAREWLQIQADLGLAHNTVEAYGRSLENYLRFSTDRRTEVISASRSHISAYVASLSHPESLGDSTEPGSEPTRPLANATIIMRSKSDRSCDDDVEQFALRPAMACYGLPWTVEHNLGSR
jgi:hypothetical protein